MRLGSRSVKARRSRSSASLSLATRADQRLPVLCVLRLAGMSPPCVRGSSGKRRRGAQVPGNAADPRARQCLLVLRLLALAQLGPVVEPLPDLALEAAIDRGIEGLARHAVGEIVLSREAFLAGVVVLVTLAVAEILHQPRRRVEDVLGRHQRAGG